VGDDDSAADDDDTAPEMTVEITSPTADLVADECEEVCFEATLSLDGEPLAGVDGTVELSIGGVIGEGVTGEDGLLRYCEQGFAPGLHEVAFSFFPDHDTVRAFTSFEARSFGYAWGLERPDEPLVELPWVPEFDKFEASPLFRPGDEGDWDASGVIMADILRTNTLYYLYYAGHDGESYQVGVATSPDGVTWERYEGNPIYPRTNEEGSWKRYATNTPDAIYDNGIFKLWYVGRAAETGTLSIGYATSTDGLEFEDYPGNPVLEADAEYYDIEGLSVAHPSVVKRGDLYEMWYATGAHYLGYALSTDGVAWVKYCNNPVLAPDQSNWDDQIVKAPEVVFDGETYEMTYTGGRPDSQEVGWAASLDGLRWLKHPDIAIGMGAEGDWDSNATVGATFLVIGDEYKAWYSGSDGDVSYVGLAVAVRETP